MKKSEKILVFLDEELYECTVLNLKKQKKEPSFLGTVYNVLNTAEKIAVSLAHLNKIRKKYEKARLKKLKKYGKVDKNGILTYGRIQRLKPATRVKRYTVDALRKAK